MLVMHPDMKEHILLQVHDHAFPDFSIRSFNTSTHITTPSTCHEASASLPSEFVEDFSFPSGLYLVLEEQYIPCLRT